RVRTAGRFVRAPNVFECSSELVRSADPTRKAAEDFLSVRSPQSSVLSFTTIYYSRCATAQAARSAGPIARSAAASACRNEGRRAARDTADCPCSGATRSPEIEEP